MPKKLYDLSQKMIDRNNSFKAYYGIRTDSETVRILFLEAYKAFGWPLEDEPVSFKRGRPFKEKDESNIVGNPGWEYPTAEKLGRPVVPSDFYTEEYKRKLGFINAEDDTKPSE